MKERDWLVPSVILTVVSGASAILLIPSYSGLFPALLILPAWMVAAGLIASICGLFRMASRGVESPFAELKRFAVQDWRKGLFLVLAVLVAGLNMITFMWVKPILNYLVPFWADPVLADLDRFLFMGYDPWTLLTWLNFDGSGLFYHQGWVATMILALLIVSCARASPEKSALMLSYFALWSVVGPLIHLLLPAAGPIFYSQMGYGGRFDALYNGWETARVANYLWAIYSSESFGAASGISAMPSLHIAVTAWIIIAFWVFARRWIVPISIVGLTIFLLSIALGWHYAVDGIVGASSAVVCYVALRELFRLKSLPFAAEHAGVPVRG